MIDIFKSLENYSHYFESQLTLSGTILGLIVATSTFIIQSGFTSFQFSRSMFIKYYVHQSKFIFLCLDYNIILSIVILYFNFNPSFLFFIHLIFAFLFSKYFLDFYSHKGYILTINSTKYNPYKTGLLKYFRYIKNLGLIQNLIAYGTIYFIFFYPLHFNSPFKLNEYQIYMTTVSCLIFCVIVIIRIIPQFFVFSEQEYKSKMKNELIDNLDIDVTKENEILKNLLIKNGRSEFIELKRTNDFDSLSIYLSNNKKEAFFIVEVEFSEKNIYEIVNAIEKYSFDFFQEVSDIHVDVNNFVLSYFIKINNDTKTRNYFIRASRNEIDELKEKNFEAKRFIERLPNKVIDELFRSI